MTETIALFGTGYALYGPERICTTRIVYKSRLAASALTEEEYVPIGVSEDVKKGKAAKSAVLVCERLLPLCRTSSAVMPMTIRRCVMAESELLYIGNSQSSRAWKQVSFEQISSAILCAQMVSGAPCLASDVFRLER